MKDILLCSLQVESVHLNDINIMLVNNLNGGHNNKHVYVHVAFVWHNKWKPLQSLTPYLL